MKEFMLIFRNEYNPNHRPSPEELQASLKKWENWIGGIAAQGKLVGTNALGFTGKTVQNGKETTDGPYAEVKEIVGGYLILKAATLDEAVTHVDGCPILEIGGKVEVRDVMVFD